MEERDPQKIINEAEELCRNIETKNLEELKEITTRLKELAEENNYNVKSVSLNYVNALSKLSDKEDLDGIKKILLEVRTLNKKYFRGEMVIETILIEKNIEINYAKKLAKLTDKPDLNELKNEEMVIAYVTELANWIPKTSLESMDWRIDIIKELNQEFPNIQRKIQNEYLKGYNNLYKKAITYEGKEIISSGIQKMSKEFEMGILENVSLKPINSNSTSNDQLDRNDISSAISSYIKMKKESISTIGIFSTWGNGKSSFIKNILKKLKEKPKKNEVEIIPIEIDAVFSDDCEKIWIIIYKKLIEEYKKHIDIKINEFILLPMMLILLIPLLLYIFSPGILFPYLIVINAITISNIITSPKYSKVYDFLLEICVYFNLFYKPKIILIANVVVFFMLKSHFMKYTEDVKIANLQTIKGSLITGVISFIWIFCDFTKNIVSVLNKESFISAYKHEEKLGFKSVIHEKINNVIEKIIDGKNRKILVIVDELDRANLDKINEIIESTHILLNNNNLIFLFSVNPKQIGKALLLKEEESLADEIDIYKYGRHYIEKYMDIYVYLPFSKDYSDLLDNIIEEELDVEDDAEVVTSDDAEVVTSDDAEVVTTDETEVVTTDEIEDIDNDKIKEIMKFPKDEKQEIKITINKITEYSNLTPRKVKTIITLSTLALQIFSSRNNGSKKEERLSLMKFILINLGLLDFMDMSEILKYEGSTYYKFLEKVISKTEKTNNDELVKDIDIDFVDSYGKEYLSLFAEKLDFN